jgi:enterochelin esterase-like enzyme
MKALAVAAAAALLSAPAGAPVFPPLPAGGGVVDCEGTAPDAPVCRLPRVFGEAEARARLAGRKIAAWDEGDVFNVLVVDDRAEVRLCCAIQAPMARVPGTDIWMLTVRVPELRRAVLDVFVFRPGEAVEPIEWRGPDAEAPWSKVGVLKGKVVNRTHQSRHMGEPRELSIYLPPGHRPDRRYPVVYLADGEGTEPAAYWIEPLILAGRIPPIVIVGLHSGENEARSRAYLLDRDRNGDERPFAHHEAFFLEEVVPLAQTEYGASAKPQDRLLMGHSNGAAWAVATALRHPDMFGQAAALSFAWPPASKVLGGPVKPRLFLAAGTLEGAFHRRTVELAGQAREAGYDVNLLAPISGHAEVMWRDLRPQALEWAFGAR